MSIVKRVAVAGALVISLAGCAAGRGATTLKPYMPVDGVQGVAQSVKVRDVVLVSLPDGAGVVVGTLVQSGDTQDRITGITVDGKPATLVPASPVLDPNAPVRFAGDTANASAVVRGLNAAPGTLAQISISFAQSGSVNLDAIVRDNKDEFAGVTAPPAQ